MIPKPMWRVALLVAVVLAASVADAKKRKRRAHPSAPSRNGSALIWVGLDPDVKKNRHTDLYVELVEAMLADELLAQDRKRRITYRGQKGLDAPPSKRAMSKFDVAVSVEVLSVMKPRETDNTARLPKHTAELKVRVHRETGFAPYTVEEVVTHEADSYARDPDLECARNAMRSIKQRHLVHRPAVTVYIDVPNLSTEDGRSLEDVIEKELTRVGLEMLSDADRKKKRPPDIAIRLSGDVQIQRSTKRPANIGPGIKLQEGTLAYNVSAQASVTFEYLDGTSSTVDLSGDSWLATPDPATPAFVLAQRLRSKLRTMDLERHLEDKQ